MKTFDITSEQSVIGSLLQDNKLWRDIEPIVNGNDFYDKRLARVFNMIHASALAMKPFDILTITEDLGDDSYLPFLGDVIQNTPSTVNAKAYAEIVKDYSKRRKLNMIADALKAKAFARDSKPDAIMEQAQSQLLDLSRQSQSSQLVSIQKVAIDYVEELEKRVKGEVKAGDSTGYADIDKYTNGMRKGNIMIIAARPSVGKTTLALNIAENLAQEGKKILFVSLEMTNDELVEKTISSQGRVDYTSLLNGTVKGEQWQNIGLAASRIKSANIMLADSQEQTIASVRKLCWDAFDTLGGLDYVFIDYVQLMHGSGNNRNEEIAEISRGLKAVAKELEIVAVPIAQLNRDIEKRSSKKPMLSDLRECGQLEQDADIVLMLHREDDGDIAEVHIAKARKGKKGEVALLSFRGEFQRFDNLDHSYQSEYWNSKQNQAGGAFKL